MANKSQDAKRSSSKKPARNQGEGRKNRAKTDYQRERDALKNAPKRKHNRDQYNSTRGC